MKYKVMYLKDLFTIMEFDLNENGDLELQEQGDMNN